MTIRRLDVVQEPDVHAAFVCADDRSAHDLGSVVVQAHVVQSELERLACRLDERRHHLRDVGRTLAAVSERSDVDQH